MSSTLPDIRFNMWLGGNLWLVQIDGAPSWLQATEDEVAEYKRRKAEADIGSRRSRG